MAQIRLIEITDEREWDDLVLASDYVTPFDSWAWLRALAERFHGMTPYPLGIEHDGELIGGIPLFLFSPVPGFRSALSLPWNLFGGLILSRPATTETVSKIVHLLESFARSHGAYELVITKPPFAPSELTRAYESHADHVDRRFTHILRLNPNFEAIWNNYNPRVRTAVRKAVRLGVQAIWSDSTEKLAEFYEIYLDSMRNFGSPPKPFEFWEYIHQSKLGRLIVAEIDGRVVSGLLILTSGNTITLWCGASLREFRSHRPNNLIFNEVIRWGCENGFGWVDFGASPPENKGLISFKEEWRAERFDFEVYRKVFSEAKKRAWEQMEPALRRGYSLLQNVKQRLHK